MNIIKHYLNSTDFITLLNESGFNIRSANFSKMKKKGILPSPDILLGQRNPVWGWKEETIIQFIDSLKHIQNEMKKNKIVEVNKFANWFNL